MLLTLAVAACSGRPAPVAPAPAADPAAAPSPAPGAAQAPPAPAEAKPGLRLPRDFRPLAYRPTIHIDPAQPTFTASIEIDGQLERPTAVVWLHARDLTVEDATATPTAGGGAVTLAATAEDKELLALRAKTPLAAGAWTLRLRYRGKLDDKETAGTFRQQEKGDWYAFTQHEATYARRTFPSVDEPDRKTPWQLTLEVPAALTALTNTMVTREQPLDGGWKRVTFAPTRPLPSYLIAFAVGPFEIIEAGKSKSGAPIRAISLKGRAKDASLAVELMPKILAYLEDWFDYPYPYDKLDLVAVPITVGFGAMENPGLVTCVARVMLVDPAKASPRDRRGLAGYVAHEFAHQWFGDLVTTAWWDDIWLNEGLATWIEDRATAHVVPSKDPALDLIDSRQWALGSDRLATARAVRQPIVTADDIESAFDGITYSKAGAVSAMFEHWLGADVFQAGIRRYVKAHADGNATSNDFIAALGEAAGRDLSAMATFLDQAGAPRVHAELTCPAGGAPAVTLTQSRYLPPGAAAPASPSANRWRFPVCIAYDRDGKRAESCQLIEDEKTTVALEAKACPKWALPNAGGFGYYRMSLPAPMVASLTGPGWKQLSTPERMVLIGELDAMINDGEAELSTGLALVPKMMREGPRGQAAAIGLASVRRAVSPAQQAIYDAWIRKTFGPLARRLGWLRRDGDDREIERLRGQVVWMVSEAKDPALVADAKKRARTWRSLPRDVRGTILAAAVEGDDELFEQLYRDVQVEPERELRGAMLGALASVEDPERLRKALGLVLEPKLDIRETARMLGGHWREPGRGVTETFFRDHMTEILARYPSDGTAGGAAGFAGIFTNACDPARRDEIAKYVTATFGSKPGGQREVAQAIEGMDQCIAWRKVNEPQVARWLSSLK